MKVQMSGTRDGVDWPDRGVEIDLPDDEAKELAASGIVEEVTAKAKVEKATAPAEERTAVTTATGPTKK